MLSSITITYTLDIRNTANLQQDLSVIHLAMWLDSGYEICTLYSVVLPLMFIETIIQVYMMLTFNCIPDPWFPYSFPIMGQM